jgi:hypothetical protein
MRTLFLAAIATLTFASAALATTDEEAAALCEAELTGPLGATALADVKIRRHEGAPWVYGNATFPDAEAVHFRCQVYHDAVHHIMYLVRTPEQASGRGWSSERPHGDMHDSGLVLDEAATAAPQAPLAMPKFEAVK